MCSTKTKFSYTIFKNIFFKINFQRVIIFIYCKKFVVLEYYLPCVNYKTSKDYYQAHLDAFQPHCDSFQAICDVFQELRSRFQNY